jgi:hypothetical protein
MKQELTPQQIEELFAFCRRHYVQYYDVQLELVDHLANAIEEKMNADKNISFEAALNTVYNNFGYKGFAGVVEAELTVLAKKNKALRWKLFFSYFTAPKIALTLLIASALIFVGTLVKEDLLKIVAIIVACFFVVFDIIFFVKSYRICKKTAKILLLVNAGVDRGIFSFMAIQLVAQSIAFSDNHEVSFWAYCIFSILICLMIIANLSFYEMNKKIMQKAYEEYPQAFTS